MIEHIERDDASACFSIKQVMQWSVTTMWDKEEVMQGIVSWLNGVIET
ncbi:hypothetical protein [Streptococcus himalayensis]|nr:hypothetical protein [Streptococcus himalayensis]